MPGKPLEAAALSASLLLGIDAAAQGVDDAKIRAELARVYDQPEFGGRGTDFEAQFLEALLRFVGRLGRLHDDAPVLFWVVLIACLALLALLITHITWVIARTAYVGWRPRTASGADERQRLSAAFRAEAESRAAASEYTEAVRLLFLSLVYAFDEAGRVPFRPALTNREYLQFFADRPSVAQNLCVFVDLLDANWYGQRSTSADQYEDCRALFERVREER